MWITLSTLSDTARKGTNPGSNSCLERWLVALSLVKLRIGRFNGRRKNGVAITTKTARIGAAWPKTAANGGTFQYRLVSPLMRGCPPRPRSILTRYSIPCVGENAQHERRDARVCWLKKSRCFFPEPQPSGSATRATGVAHSGCVQRSL